MGIAKDLGKESRGTHGHSEKLGGGLVSLLEKLWHLGEMRLFHAVQQGGGLLQINNDREFMVSRWIKETGLANSRSSLWRGATFRP